MSAPRLLLFVFAALLATLAPGTASAVGAKAPLVQVTPSVGTPGTTFQIAYTRGAARGCRVTIKQGWAGGKRIYAGAIRRRTGYAFRVKAAAKLGSRQVVVRCGARQGQAFFDVVAAQTSKDPAPTSEDDGEPFADIGASEAELADAPPLDAVGGDGPSTRMPFLRGAAFRVTQSQNGGTSHSRPSTRNAVDLAVPAGTPLLAGVSGYVLKVSGGCPPVTRSDQCGGGFGNYLLLRAGDGTCYIYAHLSVIQVAAGTTVDRYRQLGKTGNSGYSTGDHLHIDRLECARTVSLPWTFDEVGGVPRVGSTIASQNEPPASAPAPAPAPAPVPARRVITVDNRVTNGMGMREDPTPVRLQTKPWIYCGSRGCNINGTERASGGTYDAAVCQTVGERTTNGHDTNPSDDANPERFESTRYYGVRLPDGTFGLVSEVWIRAADRGGLGLPGC